MNRGRLIINDNAFAGLCVNDRSLGHRSIAGVDLRHGDLLHR